jgi:hypothetical protein
VNSARGVITEKLVLPMSWGQPRRQDSYMVHCPAAGAAPHERQPDLAEVARRRLLPRVLVAPDHDAGNIPVDKQHGLLPGRVAQQPVLVREVEPGVRRVRDVARGLG